MIATDVATSQDDYVTAHRRRLARERDRRQRARNAGVRARMKDLAAMKVQIAFDAITPDPEWLTAARRNLLDADTIAFAPTWAVMEGRATDQQPVTTEEAHRG